MTRPGRRRWLGVALRDGKLCEARAGWRNEKSVAVGDGHLDRSGIADQISKHVTLPMPPALGPILDALDTRIWSLTLLVAAGDASTTWEWRSGANAAMDGDGVSRLSGLEGFSVWLETLPIRASDADAADA